MARKGKPLLADHKKFAAVIVVCQMMCWNGTLDILNKVLPKGDVRKYTRVADCVRNVRFAAEDRMFHDYPEVGDEYCRVFCPFDMRRLDAVLDDELCALREAVIKDVFSDGI